jgi:nucleotide-binding universal stress UspA family protein
MFERIMFATTASPTCDHAANVAFDLAKKYDSTLFVFHVLGVPTRGYSQFVKDVRTGEMEIQNEDYHEWVKEEMRNTYAKQMEGYDKIELLTSVGAPHTEILRAARKQGADLVVMGAHTREEDVGATRHRSVVGDVMQRVAKGARCPVLIISRPCETCWWYFSNIIFGTDFSKAAHSAFLFAYQVAKEIGCKLYLFHALDISGVHSGRTHSQKEIEGLIAQAKEKMEKIYISQMKDFDNYEIEIWEGIPYVEILKYAREKQGDLIVMAHHAREIDPDEAVLGSTVEQVVLTRKTKRSWSSMTI